MTFFFWALIFFKNVSSKDYTQINNVHFILSNQLNSSGFRKDNRINNGHFTLNELFKSKKNYRNFKGLDMAKDSVKIKFEGRALNLTLPIYIDTNRYFLPLTEIITELDGKSTITGKTISVEVNNLKKTLESTNFFDINGNQIKLKENLIISDDYVYLSMIDFCRIFNLKTDWDIEHKVLSFYFNREKLVQKQQSSIGKPALIRLEDIAAGHFYNQTESLEKLRIITDYLYAENIPFHVAWVPRYIDPRPSSLLDNDISQQNNMLNADFVYTLDYMLDKNGLIGLHGYTHQYKNTESVGGTEFHLQANDGIPATDQYVQGRVTAAIEAANRLSIPYSFFETPHYAIAASHLKVLEKNFKIIYEYYPGMTTKIVNIKNGDKTTKYIPTPLDYVNGKTDAPKMIQKINNLKDSTLASFFYHPHLEFSEIQVSKEADGYPTYTYKESSILHQLIGLFKEKGYRFTTINEIN